MHVELATHRWCSRLQTTGLLRHQQWRTCTIPPDRLRSILQGVDRTPRQIAAREAAHQWSLASLRGRNCGRPPRWQPAYALMRHADVGHWDLSPEWFGTQAGGWGRGAGEVVFQRQSKLGNGEVVVTAHPASSVRGSCVADEEQWRVLRFNEATRQSVARVHQAAGSAGSGWAADARCLAFEYMKTIAAAVASVIGVSGLHHWARAQQLTGSMGGRAVCIGMGGGSVPLFLSHHFPQLKVEAVDLDPVVISAAREAMGFPADSKRLCAVQADAVDHVARLAAESPGGVDLAIIDVFDGMDATPPAVSSPAFLRDLAAALHPDHGTAVVNLHGGGPGAVSSLGRLLGRGQTGPGYKTDNPAGAAVDRISRAYRDALIPPCQPAGPPGGIAYTISAASQHNIIAVVSRAMRPGAASGLQAYETVTRLQSAADEVSGLAGFTFSTANRATRGFQLDSIIRGPQAS